MQVPSILVSMVTLWKAHTGGTFSIPLSFGTLILLQTLDLSQNRFQDSSYLDHSYGLNLGFYTTLFQPYGCASLRQKFQNRAPKTPHGDWREARLEREDSYYSFGGSDLEY